MTPLVRDDILSCAIMHRERATQHPRVLGNRSMNRVVAGGVATPMRRSSLGADMTLSRSKRTPGSRPALWVSRQRLIARLEAGRWRCPLVASRANGPFPASSQKEGNRQVVCVEGVAQTRQEAKQHAEWIHHFVKPDDGAAPNDLKDASGLFFHRDSPTLIKRQGKGPDNQRRR